MDPQKNLIGDTAAVPDEEMSLAGHLGELRSRLIVAIVAITLCTAGGFFCSSRILDLLTSPILNVPRQVQTEQLLTIEVTPDGTLKLADPADSIDLTTLKTGHIRFRLAQETENEKPRDVIIGPANERKFFYSNPIDPFMLQFKIAFMVGLFLALPIVLFEIWRFVKPGLTPRERRMVRPTLACGVVLFPIGAAFAFAMIRVLLIVMQTFQIKNVDPLLDIFQYLSLLTTMMIVFGVVFEMPLAITIASRLGLVTPSMLTVHRRHIWLGLAFASMIITPADPLTMLMAFFPLVALFEASVILSKLMHIAYKGSFDSANGGASEDNDHSEVQEA